MEPSLPPPPMCTGDEHLQHSSCQKMAGEFSTQHACRRSNRNSGISASLNTSNHLSERPKESHSQKITKSKTCCFAAGFAEKSPEIEIAEYYRWHFSARGKSPRFRVLFAAQNRGVFRDAKPTMNSWMSWYLQEFKHLTHKALDFAELARTTGVCQVM